MKNFTLLPKNRFPNSVFKFLCFLLFISQAGITSANALNTCTCKDTVDVFVDGATGFLDLSPSLFFDGDGVVCNYDSIAIDNNGSIVNCNNIGRRPGQISISTFSSGNFIQTCTSFVRVGGNCACWDLNGDGIAQASEDVNTDGVVDLHDCFLCHDLNKNRTIEIFEDLNGDGVIDNRDCCWDSNADGFNYPSEDINNDGVYDSRDCGLGPLVNVQDLITFMDPCACGDPNNCDVAGITYFHDLMTVPGSGTISAGLDIRVLSSTDFYVDVPCTGGALSEPILGRAGTTMVEVSPGVYELEFWRPSGILPTFSIIVDGATTATAPASTFEPVCFQEECVIEPIPTMGEWGLMVLGLLLLIFGVKAVESRAEYALN